MKVLAASDLHGSHATYEWLVEACCDSGVDAMILAGDLLGGSEESATAEEGQRHDAERIVDILSGVPVRIYYIMGNDDLVDLDPRSDQFVPIHGRRIELGGVNLVGYQFSLPFMGGVNEKPEETIREDLGRLATLVDQETALVTHSPAYGILDEAILGRRAGSRAIRELVETRNVRAHVHGHIHREFGRSGCHFNVASGRLRRAMVIDLDDLTATVKGDPGAGT